MIQDQDIDQMLATGSAEDPRVVATVEPDVDALLAGPQPLTFADALREASIVKAIPFVGGAVEVAETLTLRRAAQALESGTQTPEQEQLVYSLLEHSDRTQTVGYKFGSVLAQIPAYAGEFMATGGLFTAGKAAGRKAVTAMVGKAVRESAEKAAEGLAARALTRAVGAAAGTVAQTALGMPHRVAQATLEASLPKMGIADADAGEVAMIFQGSTQDFLESLPQGLADMAIEVGSERVGSLLPFQGAVLSAWMKKTGGTAETFLARVSKQAGWNGVLGEVFEERVGDVARGLTPGLPETLEDAFPGWEQIAAEAMAFSVPGAIGAAARGVESLVAPGGAEAAQEALAEPQEQGEAPTTNPLQEPIPEAPAPVEAEVPAEVPATGAAKEAQPVVALSETMSRTEPGTPREGVQEPRRRTQRPVESDLGESAYRDAESVLSAPEGASQVTAGRDIAGSVEAQTDERTDKSKVQVAYENILRVIGSKAPVRTGLRGTSGRRSSSGVLGLYRLGPKVVRVRTHGDLTTIAHEVAHALQDHIFAGRTKAGKPKGGISGQGKTSPWLKDPAIPQAAKEELTKLGLTLYPEDASKPGKIADEGFAEYVRHYLTRDDAKEVAPEFTRFFEGTFLAKNPELKEAIAEARRQTDVWRGQGSVARVAGQIADRGGAKNRVKRLIAEGKHHLGVDKWIEAGVALQRAVAEAETIRGKPFREAENPWTLYRAWRMKHTARVDYMVRKGMINIAGEKVGPALNEIGPLIKGRLDEFVVYYYAKRAKALLTDPKGPRDPGVSLADAEATIAALESPQFELAASKVYDWADGVLDYAAQASPSMAVQVERIRARDPGFYAPLSREMEEGVRRAIKGSARGDYNVSKRLKGSGRRIFNPLESLVENATNLVLQAHQRAVAEAIVKMSRTVPGLGHLVEELPPINIPAGQADLAAALNEALKALPPDAAAQIRSILETVAESEGELDLGSMTVWAQQTKAPNGQAILPYWEEKDGKRKLRMFQFDPAFYDVVAGMDIYRLPRVLDLLVGVPVRFFRLSTTGLRASFTLFTNPTRDFQTFHLNSQAATTPSLVRFFHYVGEYFKAGFAAVGGEADPYLDLYQRLGGPMAQSLSQDVDFTRRAIHGIARDKKMILLHPVESLGTAFDWVRDVFQFPETAARTTEVKLVAKEIDWEPGQHMSIDQSLRLLIAGSEVTTDFNAAGSYARVMNQIVPFFNAAIQGPRAALRSLKRNPLAFGLHGAQITAATLALWWMIKDEEWYAEMELRKRFLYWFVPGPNDTLIVIPRAFETGMLFAALPEAMIDAAYREEPEQVQEWMTAFIDVVNPWDVPPMAKEIAQQYANQDFFFDRPIVPRSIEGKPLEEQVDDYTTRAAKLIGDVLGVSPMRVDHAVRSIGGGAAGDVMALSGRVGGTEREWEASDFPAFGKMFQRGGRVPTSPRSVNALYDELERRNRLSQSDVTEEPEEAREARLFLNDAARAVSALGAAIRATPTLEERTRLKFEQIQIAKDALRAVEEGSQERGPMRLARKQAEARAEEAEAAK